MRDLAVKHEKGTSREAEDVVHEGRGFEVILASHREVAVLSANETEGRVLAA